VNNTEVVTMTDKDKRDAMYQDLRTNGDELERQVVRFSSYKPVLNENGAQQFFFSRFGGPGELNERPIYQQTWSIAYPRS
jgi:hypothetical protein